MKTLTPGVFHILLALVDQERHGYGIMLEVAERTNQQVRMGPGTLYGTLKRMLEGSLIEECDERITLYRNAYSERARRAIYLARLEKGPFSYGEISLENLLMGALRSDEELTSALLGSHGVETLVTMVRAMETNKVVPRSPLLRWEHRRPRREGTLDLDCKKALAKARQEAHDSGAQVSSRNILSGILDQDTSLAARLLRERALDLSYLRNSADPASRRPNG
jgi:ATP-dependent Clp protease ATP-binding subunit ClpA